MRRALTWMLTVGMRRPLPVVGFWVAAAVALFALVTPLPQVVEKSSTAFLPSEASTLQGFATMDREFGSGRTRSFVFVVVTAEDGLEGGGNVGEDEYERLAQTFRAADAVEVTEVRDYIAQPETRSVLRSEDGRAAYLVVGLRSTVGSPESDRDVRAVRDLVERTDPPAGTEVHVTGDPAMIADLTTAINDASAKITFVSVGLLLVILFIVYRSFSAIAVPLITIGVALACTRGLLSIAGEHGLRLSTYTDAFVIAITLGAGTDYCVFLLSRFREERRDGASPLEAVSTAATRVGPALLASAATVILGAISLGFAKIAIFSTTGPPMAICVAVTVLVSLTLTPALIRLLAPRIRPAPAPRPNGPWVRTGQLVARRPATVLAAGVGALGLLALMLPTTQLSYDERSAQPPSTPSNQGLAALSRHFPANEVLPDYLLIQSDRDMRNSRDLATLNTVSTSLTKIDGVQRVRSITQPDGTPLKPAQIANQLARVADGLQRADTQLDKGRPRLSTLADGADQLTNGIGRAADGAGLAGDAADQLGQGSTRITDGLGRASQGAQQASNGSRRLRDAANSLAAGLQTAHDQVAAAVQGLGAIADALDNDLLCTTDPICNRSRKGLRAIYLGQRDKLLPGLAEAARGAEQIAQGNGDLANGLDRLDAGLQRAQDGSRQITRGQLMLADKLDDLSAGTEQLSTGAAQIAPGVDQLLDQTSQLSQGLADSGEYLDTINQRADTADSAGFYLPASALNKPQFSLARNTFLSADGRTARIEITGTTDPLSPEGLRRYQAIQGDARQSLRGTTLESAHVSATGAGGLGADLSHYLKDDATLVVLGVLAVVFLVLVLTLRALAAPLFLLASVVLSSAAAIGLTVLLFQHGLGEPLHFTVPVIVFVLLVAVGADYNILLMTRMRETGQRLTRAEVARAVTATGPVITAAGIIFASTFVALLFSPVIALAQTGFAVAAGLLLDTFVVRTLIVPACAALLEQRTWWPSARTTSATKDAL